MYFIVWLCCNDAVLCGVYSVAFRVSHVISDLFIKYELNISSRKKLSQPFPTFLCFLNRIRILEQKIGVSQKAKLLKIFNTCFSCNRCDSSPTHPNMRICEISVNKWEICSGSGDWFIRNTLSSAVRAVSCDCKSSQCFLSAWDAVEAGFDASKRVFFAGI